MGGADDVIDHRANAVVLEEAVSAGGGLPLELLRDEALEPLDVLVGRSSNFQESRRHRRRLRR